MKTILLAGAAALAAIATPLAAQDAVAVDAEGNVYVLTPEQEALVTAWPAERVTLYKAWPYNYQEYFWTLDTPRQDGWWLLTDDQRAQLFAMSEEQREATWASIAAQMNASTPVAATTAAAVAPAGGTQFVSRAVVQTTPAAATANVAAGDLPVCKGDQQDGCINSWEKNKTGNRPLNYWPGKPASEIDGKLPAEKPAGE